MSHCSTKVTESLLAMLTSQMEEMDGAEGVVESIGEMEAQLSETMRVLGRIVFQAQLERLGKAQMPPEVACSCGGQAHYVRMRECVLPTVFGRIAFKRGYYLCPDCHKGHAPWMMLLATSQGR